MKPEIWGPHAWIFLHSITFDYPDNPTKEVKEKYKGFFESLQDILPCEKCRNHYKKNIKKYPLNEYVLKNRKNLIEWLIDLHNIINKMNGKPTLSYKQVIKKYLDYYEGKEQPRNELQKCNNNNSITSNLIVIISILLVTVFILKKENFNKLIFKNKYIKL